MIPEALFIAYSFKLNFEEVEVAFEVHKCILERLSSTNIFKFLNERN